MNVTFFLGPGGAHLASRHLTVTRMSGAGDDSAPSATYDNASLAGTDEVVAVDVPSGHIYQAVLIDTNGAGTTSVPQVLNFHTGSLQFPGSGAKAGDFLCILEMEDESSSSSSQSSSSWSSQSSQSSSSSSSQSSISTSSSSISTSSSSQSSTSSISTSSSSLSASSSSQSTSSSSQSSSSSSSSSQSSSSSSSQSSSSSSSSESSSSWSSQS